MAEIENHQDLTFRYEYYLTDHLGNTRVHFADADGNGSISSSEILAEHHYYPFGMEMNGDWQGNGTDPEQRYRYNGKEYQDQLGLYDYGARWYDPSIARWTTLDPLAELDHNLPLSPYNYVANNPISNIDPDGMDWFRNNETGEEYWEDRTDANDGETALGAWNIVEGKNGWVVHYQQEVYDVVSKADGNTYDTALAREAQGMSSKESLEGFSDREAEAINQMPGLISDALLTYAPTPKAAQAAKLAPVFSRIVPSILARSTLVNTIKSTGTQIFRREGSKGFSTALKDFGELGATNVRTIQTVQGKVVTGKLSNGRTVVAIPFSKPKKLDPGGPTLEIQGGANPIKIRY